MAKKNLELEAKLILVKQNEGAYLITNQGIGEVKLGMTLEEARTFSTINIERYFDGDYGEEREIECFISKPG